MTRYTITELEPREYQNEAAEWSRRRDSAVVCLPTGSGKTLVGCQWACLVLNQTDAGRILVVEPSRYLVEQTTEYFGQHTDIQATALYGTTAKSDRKNRWEATTIVVTTPQTAYNDIEWLEFDAAIIDECHHTTGQHAFANLMREYKFESVLGLSATIPNAKEAEITNLIGEIRRWTWEDLPAEHVPGWLGEVYDTPYPADYQPIIDALEDFRLQWEGMPESGLATLGIRMLCRDGGLALSDTLAAETKMGDLMHETITPHLETARDLHKLSACRAALENHDFDKAVLFVNRVVVAKQLAKQLKEYNTVTVLGRLRSGSQGQQQAVERAQAEETDLIIATAAGEEGMDLPQADLLIVWSNVVSAVRFIQRLGRVMRKGDREKPKAAVYLATPESPDYSSLREGVAAAKQAGHDIGRLGENLILDKTEAGMIQTVVSTGPQRLRQITRTVQQPTTKVENWLRTLVREGDICYLYHVPDNLDEWRTPGPFSDIFSDDDETQQVVETRNNLSPAKEQRYYLNEDDLPVSETDFPELVCGDGTHRLEVSFGPSHELNNKYSKYGRPDSLVDPIVGTVDDTDKLYATVSYSSSDPIYSFQMLYQGSPTKPVVRAIVRNADSIATILDQSITTDGDDRPW